ncbi:hypothetical protein M9H77_29613 [Catharanthus roseus]|uniref:Uncharacterized protein n=1 Tax=Catharanthus roseus TaxID=4058 RepID=A0ACB9ZYS9_CATRO|nr:hypothetical protein M9H77_29613 [Catharanthus roseus]
MAKGFLNHQFKGISLISKSYFFLEVLTSVVNAAWKIGSLGVLRIDAGGYPSGESTSGERSSDVGPRGRIGSELHDKQSPFGRKTFSGRKSRRKDVFVKAV